MKTFISALMLVGLSVFTAQAQQQTSKQVIKKIIDITPDGTKTTIEIYATGTSSNSSVKVKPPKGTDVIHEEQTYDAAKKAFVTTNKLMANGKSVNYGAAPTNAKPQSVK